MSLAVKNRLLAATPGLAVGLAVLLAALLSFPALAQEKVDLELVLLADASGSIDSEEIRFQRQGYAEALNDPTVLGAIAQGFEGKIAVTYVEWAAAHEQEVVVPWTVIDGAASAKAFAGKLMAAPRTAYGRNAIGSALTAAQALIEGNDIEGFRRVIDFSGDSANSWDGIPLALARANALAADIVINGLAVLCRICSGPPNDYDLGAAFESTIVGGPGHFVVVADGSESFSDAVRRKLLLEIAGVTNEEELAARLRKDALAAGAAIR